MLPSDYACPSCKCRACYALHRKGPLDWILSVLGLRPAKCLTCGRRFHTRYKLSEDGKYILKRGSQQPVSSAPPASATASGSPQQPNRDVKKNKAA